MNASILTTAAALSDRALLSRLQHIAGNERAALVELLAHLAELDTRRSVYAAEGFGSLFAYCTGALRLSEDAAGTRIEAARACRRFPAILDLLAEGSLTLTAVRMLAGHLTTDNHAEVLSAARRRTKREIEALVARLAPRPDAKPVIRRLADPRPVPTPVDPPAPPGTDAPSACPNPDDSSGKPAPPVSGATGADGRGTGAPGPAEPEVPRPAPVRRPVIRASAPARFLVQLTVGQGTHDRFRRLQALCARECRGGDPVAVFDLVCLVAEKEMLRRKRAAKRDSGRVVPAGAPTAASAGAQPSAKQGRANGRHIAADVSRAVWARDGERCAFVGPAGRCTETKFLELHHRIPWVLGGPATTDNLAVRCRLHNVYEAESAFGARPARPSPGAVRPPADVVPPRAGDAPPPAV